MPYFIIPFLLGILLLVIIESRFRASYIPVECTEYDRIAADQAIILSHAYAQTSQGLPINFAEEVREKVFVIHRAIPAQYTQGWDFYPLWGNTGLQKWRKVLFKKSLLGLIGCNKEKKIISIIFRNTRNIYDWLSNLNFTFTKNEKIAYKGLAHEGASSILSSCINELNTKLQQLQEQGQKLCNYTFIIGGHSLGGALATLLVTHIIENKMYKQYIDLAKVKLITFGAPYAIAKYEKHDCGKWIAQSIPYIKCFERTTDMAPIVARFIKMQTHKLHSLWYGEKQPTLEVIPAAQPIPLFHFNNSRFNLVGGHNIEKYREAIYIELGLPYKALHVYNF